MKLRRQVGGRYIARVRGAFVRVEVTPTAKEKAVAIRPTRFAGPDSKGAAAGRMAAQFA